ncbi:Uncharacterized protein APZ42_020584 [Daphnia magna]|uniref:Uncharacterized protein n=1 Tax=Daphnia magna TaxID=35525 RepID=A0A164X6U2_9CRUS|nr:Uncharacterized protein APZ42_020584 [Daphnia magna]
MQFHYRQIWLFTASPKILQNPWLFKIFLYFRNMKVNMWRFEADIVFI